MTLTWLNNLVAAGDLPAPDTQPANGVMTWRRGEVALTVTERTRHARHGMDLDSSDDTDGVLYAYDLRVHPAHVEGHEVEPAESASTAGVVALGQLVAKFLTHGRIGAAPKPPQPQPHHYEVEVFRVYGGNVSVDAVEVDRPDERLLRLNVDSRHAWVRSRVADPALPHGQRGTTLSWGWTRATSRTIASGGLYEVARVLRREKQAMAVTAGT